jgi:COP9 signalosome complex subunit 7
MSSELEQFCLIARSQKDRACANIIQQVLKDKKIHVFGELLAVPSVQALRGSEFSNALETLELFAYGTYSDFSENPTRYLEMTPSMIQKLRRLSLFSLAAKNNKLSYDSILTSLQLQTVRELEDFILDLIYSELMLGKLDQIGQVLTVTWITPRDVRPESLPNVIEQFVRWQTRCQVTKEVLQRSSRDAARKRAENEQENAEVQKLAEVQRERIREKVEAGMMHMDVDEMSGLGTSNSNRSYRNKPGSRTSALDRLGLGIGGGIGGGRSSNTTFLSGSSNSRSKF